MICLTRSFTYAYLYPPFLTSFSNFNITTYNTNTNTTTNNNNNDNNNNNNNFYIGYRLKTYANSVLSFLIFFSIFPKQTF